MNKFFIVILNFVTIGVLCLTLVACGGAGGSGEEDNTDLNSDNDLQKSVLHSCGTEEEPLRIMPLGDSITEAAKGQNSYRYTLWHNLLQAGCVVDFVGSRHGVSLGFTDSPQVPALSSDFDQDHEGHWSYRADELLEFIPIWIDRFQPHIVLVHLGTNDILDGQAVESTIDDLGKIIDDIRLVKSDIIILLAKVIPSILQTDKLEQLNEIIGTLDILKADDLSPLFIIDLADGYSQSYNYDGIHPGVDGEIFIANRWTNAILQLVDEG